MKKEMSNVKTIIGVRVSFEMRTKFLEYARANRDHGLATFIHKLYEDFIVFRETGEYTGLLQKPLSK